MFNSIVMLYKILQPYPFLNFVQYVPKRSVQLQLYKKMNRPTLKLITNVDRIAQKVFFLLPHQTST